MAALHTIWARNYGNLWLLNSAYITLIPKKSDAEQGLPAYKFGAQLRQIGNQNPC